MLSDIEVIDGAIELISADGAFCKGTFCRDASGEAVNFPAVAGFELEDYTAQPVSFCLEGAIGYVNGYFLTVQADGLYRQWARLLEAVMQYGLPEMGPVAGLWPSLHTFNDRDDTGQEDAILALKNTKSWLEG